jgi:Protein of unknown function (DUF2567)
VTDAPHEPMASASVNGAPDVDPDVDKAPDEVTGAPPRRLAGSITAAVAVGVVVSLAGIGIGVLWAEVAPRVAVIKAEQGFLYADSEPEQAVAGDGWFAILGAVAGLLFAVIAWYLLRRHRGPMILFGLTLGSLAGAVLAWWVGYKIGLAQFDQARQAAAVGARLNAPLGLRITDLSKDHLWTPIPTGVAAVQALVAAAVYTVLAGFSAHSDLRGDPLPAYQPRSYQPLPFYQSTELPETHPDQFGPGFTGSSESATGTART